jgi:predicted nucleotidyltransferase
MTAGSGQARRLSRSLAGYLCGTHSGLLGRNAGDRLRPRQLSAEHLSLAPERRDEQLPLGARSWEPAGEASELRAALDPLLGRPEVVEVLVFGSQARGATTGFSDLDAVLVIADAAAEDHRRLASLRDHVIAAQRRVLHFQPMQHHGFEVVTPKLLELAGDALDLPAAALAQSRSLGGTPVQAHVDDRDAALRARARLQALAASLSATAAWPPHPWRLHRIVSMFELLPALYLQALGRPVPKWLSFAEARQAFPRTWWPYDVLREVREVWPRRERRPLALAATWLRNPWPAVAGWARLPSAPARAPARLLSPPCLAGLQVLAAQMVEEAA